MVGSQGGPSLVHLWKNPFDIQSNLKRSWSGSASSEVCRLVGTATYATRTSGGVGERFKIPFLPD